MAKKPKNKPSKDVGEDKRPAGAPVEHPTRMPRRRDPYKTRVIMPDRANDYDIKG